MNSCLKSLFLLLFVIVGSVSAQTAGLIPLGTQFFDNNGEPLAGGLLYTCAAGSACPGTLQAAYTDSTGFTPLPNPVVLDPSGRAFVWLSTTLQYKLVLQTSAAVNIWTLDNVSSSAFSAGGATTNYWTLTGSTIANNNGSGTGAVTVGSDFTTAGNLYVTGQLKLRDAQGSPNYAILRANPVMTVDTLNTWPAANLAGVLTNDGAGNLSWGAGGGGGGGSAAGGNGQVQFSNGSGTFLASGNLVWDNVNQKLSVIGVSSTAGFAIGVGSGTGAYFQSNGTTGGFVAPTATAYNAIQAPAGGVHALSGTFGGAAGAGGYVNIGNNMGAPTPTSGDGFNPGAMYWDTSSHALKVYNESMAFVTVATGGATSPGGSNFAVQVNSAGSFGGTANFTVGVLGDGVTVAPNLVNIKAASMSVAGLNVQTGFISSDLGFLTLGTPTTVIQAPNGGVTGKWLIATDSVFLTEEVQPALSALGQARIYADSTAHNLFVSENGGAYALLGGGGGGGTPGGVTTSVQFNKGGTLGGSNNVACPSSSCFSWDDLNRKANISGVINTATLNVQNGFMQVDGGLTSVVNPNWNSIQSVGGFGGRSFTATTYVQTGSGNIRPTVSTGDTFHFGTMYFDTGLGLEQVCAATTCTGGGGGTGWVSLATGGLSSLNALTGALTLVGTTNEIIITPSGGNTLTFSTPQNIGTASPVTFGSLTTTGTGVSVGGSGSIQTTGTGGILSNAGVAAATGYLIGLSSTVINSSSQFVGSGGVSTAGPLVTTNNTVNAVLATGGINVGNGSANGIYAIGGNTVINNARTFVGSGGVATAGAISTSSTLSVTGTSTFAAASTFNGGINVSSGSNSTIFIGGGNLYNRVTGGATGISCAGVANGWIALTSDNYLVVCNANGTRLRTSQLQAF